MLELTLIQKIAIGLLPIMLAVTVHEAAHAYAANFFGDGTAKFLGRMTLNPIRHIDILGTIIIPLTMFILTSFVFGWAKPVPVNAQNFKNPRRDMALVALAGPLSNIVMAFAWAGMTAIGVAGLSSGAWYAEPLALMGQIGIFVNILLAVFNLLPLPPLDGGRVLVAILPPKAANTVSRLEPWGFPILLLLLFTGVLSFVLLPILYSALAWFNGLIHLL
ncbi:MAG: site-2 protease family protein [Halothiobacillus sp. 24-54-40]|nr:site-2 protease family protein [Halothiobacillaceae bacterium]OYV47612.1 MAG: site-2 protease family protein [Halothiobacillus sp. 20-53-49]OYY35500.1 MAG: site-2 protease family protein [Halothiobacillus sp. 35-54-62]OYZ85735.1 MAG: site-2 protease family protein [Halothiobacillus sp. 24-54-40]OZA79923.1 MAG: site-2 protease family protein [Halothiobacillus sp. 39-53-45]HQS02667.1 site-2 protease family protein [Halothiobacillus sp.]